jgi:hypothetical protein
MKSARSLPKIVFLGFLPLFLTLSGAHSSFGQAPPGAAGAAQAPQPVAADAPPAAAAQPVPLPAAPPLQPDPASAALPAPAPALQPDPAAPAQPAAAQPAPAAPVQPVPGAAVQPFPPAALPSLSLTRGSHLIGARAVLAGGVLIGTVQDLLFVADSGEYVLVANPSGFVTVPQSMTIFEPGPRILRVNMTFAQVAELPRLLRLGQLDRQFLGRVHTFFRSPRGLAILREGAGRNARGIRPGRAVERRTETRTAERRVDPRTLERRETRTAGKPVIERPTRTEPRATERRPEKEPDPRR